MKCDLRVRTPETSHSGRFKAFLTLLLLFASVGTGWAQDQKVSGRVTDTETGEPIAGVSVYMEGSSRGTATNIAGEFSLELPKSGKLIFSMLGYETLTTEIGGRTVINVKLRDVSTELEAVVAIGYATVAKSNVTSAISSITEADIMKTPVSSIEQAIQGNAAGVFVITTSAEPGGESTIRIRGGSSVSGSNEPLVVIDGFPSENSTMATINPSDILSIEILKYAGATAIYGSRGANGVIMITTKNGEGVKPSLNVKVNYGIKFWGREIPVFDGPLYTKYDNLGRMNWGINSLKSAMPDTVATRDFQGDLIRSMAQRQEYNVSISGSSQDKNIKYFISAGYLSEDGILNHTSSDRLTWHMKLEAKLHKNVSLTVSNSLARVERETTSGGGSGATLRTLMLNPTSTTEGTYVDGMYIDEETGEILSIQSETARALNSNQWTKDFAGGVNGTLRWSIGKHLTFTSLGQYRYTDKQGYSYTPRSIFSQETQIDKNNKATRATSINQRWSNENFLTYNRKLNRHKLTLTFGQSWEKIDREGYGAGARRFSTDHYGWNNLAAGAYQETLKSSRSASQLLSFFHRTLYSYDDRLIGSVSIRTDGSSRFGEDRRFGWFPAVTAAWNLHKEKWMKGSSSWLSNLKLRADWGISGNDEIGDYQSMTLLTTKNVLVDGIKFSGTALDRLGNKNLQWETESSINAGVDVGLWRNRVTFSVDAYYKQTFNQLYRYRVPLTTGYTTIYANIGSSENRGFEFESKATVVNSRNFTWVSSFNIGYNENKVTDLGGNDDVLLYYLGDNVNQNITYLMLGQPQAVFKGYRTSIYRSWDEVYADNAILIENPETFPTIPGMLRYEDTNGDGVINDDDKVVLGQALPRIMGGFTNTFTFLKNWSVTVFINYSWGGSAVNTNYSKLKNYRAGASDNQVRYVLDAYRKINPIYGDPGYADGKYPTPSSNSKKPNTSILYQQDLIESWVESTAFIRLKTLTLTYSFPKKLVNKAHMKAFDLSLTATDLVTLTRYTGYDPEKCSSLGSGSDKLGIDQSSYPPTVGFLLNANIRF